MAVPRLELATTLEAEDDRIVRLPILRDGRMELQEPMQAGEFIEHEPGARMVGATVGHQSQDQQLNIDKTSALIEADDRERFGSSREPCSS